VWGEGGDAFFKRGGRREGNPGFPHRRICPVFQKRKLRGGEKRLGNAGDFPCLGGLGEKKGGAVSTGARAHQQKGGEEGG